MKPFEYHVKEMKEMEEMAILTWLSVFFLVVISLIWMYYGGKAGPWIILGFAIFQNIPLAIMYMIRYKRASKMLAYHVEFHNQWEPSQMMTDDPIAAEVMTRALNSGNIVFANIDDDGNVNYSEIERQS